MTFDLVHCRDDAGNLPQLFQMADIEIADTDASGTPGIKNVFQLFPGT